ncbi:MAG: addiction module toxin, HicA family [Dehalococcoidia bacterium]|nr:addiction module toxin, HicA family [Dehalococcoidia bacterium]MQY82045.1 addiction module toxin, HicA family [Dehalococcoidia bacterium]
MSQLPLCSSKQIIDALIKDGFQLRSKSKRGSHQVLQKKLPSGRTIVVPVVIGKKEVPRGTLSSILRLAQIDRDHFLSLL